MKKILSIVVIFITTIALIIPTTVHAADTNWVGSHKIDSYMSELIEKEKVPGISMVIVDGDEVIFRSYGHENIKEEIAADEYTIYELGSTTKVFTALAVLILDAIAYVGAVKGEIFGPARELAADLTGWFSTVYIKRKHPLIVS